MHEDFSGAHLGISILVGSGDVFITWPAGVVAIVCSLGVSQRQERPRCPPAPCPERRRPCRPELGSPWVLAECTNTWDVVISFFRIPLGRVPGMQLRVRGHEHCHSSEVLGSGRRPFTRGPDTREWTSRVQ